ncbi:MAG: hypothetical protein KFF73_17755 [Cyclobacteriaceae bacterium]|nr:hypothetical protein [Cyclobacteriaceae bacterium]
MKIYHYGLFLVCLGSILLEGCSSESEPDPVNCNANPVSIVSVSSMEATCGVDDGSLTISASGGSGDYTYSINGTDFQSSATFQNLGAGNYTVTARDVNECSASGSAIIESTSGITLTAEVTSVAGCDSNNGELSVDVSGGEAPYQYKLDDGSFQDNAVFSGLEAGSYTVFARDVNGCLVTSPVEVKHGTSLEDEVMTIITANCAISGCHDGNSGIPDWSNMNNVIANATNIKNLTGNGTMPPEGRSITDEEISTIACWVDDGAADN